MILSPILVRPAVKSVAGNNASVILSSQDTKYSPIYSNAPVGVTDRRLAYFVSVFLRRNMFLSRNVPVADDLLTMWMQSSGLRDAIHAIVILDDSRKFQVNRLLYKDCSKPSLKATRAYIGAVQKVQSAIASGTLIMNPSALWTTLFLGVFEVCQPRRVICAADFFC